LAQKRGETLEQQPKFLRTSIFTITVLTASISLIFSGCSILVEENLKRIQRIQNEQAAAYRAEEERRRKLDAEEIAARIAAREAEKAMEREKEEAKVKSLVAKVPCKYPMLYGLAIGVGVGVDTQWIDIHKEESARVYHEVTNNPLSCSDLNTLANYCTGYYIAKGDIVKVTGAYVDRGLIAIDVGVDLIRFGRRAVPLATKPENLTCSKADDPSPRRTE
jgi:hypothetical protein